MGNEGVVEHVLDGIVENVWMSGCTLKDCIIVEPERLH
jgi:hypothetical protein